MGELTRCVPKALLDISGKSLIQRLVESIRPFEIDDVIVVGGFQFERLQTHLKGLDDKIRCLKNLHFDRGSVLSLLVGERSIHGDFVVMNADHLYSSKILRLAFTSAPGFSDHRNISILCDFDRTLMDDDMKISLKPDGSLKSISKDLSTYRGGYIGLTRIPGEITQSYWETAKRISKKDDGRANVESILGEWLETGGKIEIIDASGSVWFEVDTEDDYMRAKAAINSLDCS